jgi:hypothetical protein
MHGDACALRPRPAALSGGLKPEVLLRLVEPADLDVVLEAEIVPPAGQREAPRHRPVVAQCLIIEPGLGDTALVALAVV